MSLIYGRFMTKVCRIIFNLIFGFFGCILRNERFFRFSSLQEDELCFVQPTCVCKRLSSLSLTWHGMFGQFGVLRIIADRNTFVGL